MEKVLPSIPAKRYFTIGEVSELCGVKPYVLRYWEQEFTQLKPVKRRGNRRYYQHHEVLLIRRIRDLLYDQGFTISGARNRLTELGQQARSAPSNGSAELTKPTAADTRAADVGDAPDTPRVPEGAGGAAAAADGARVDAAAIARGTAVDTQAAGLVTRRPGPDWPTGQSIILWQSGRSAAW